MNVAFLTAVTLLVLTVPQPSHAAKTKPKHINKVWVHPEFARFDLRKIAILPGVTYDGNHQASSAAVNGWFLEFDTTGYEWVPADKVRLKLNAASRQRDSLLNAINAQVQKSGRVDALTAGALSRLLDVQGVLCLRVDRWQMMNAASARQTATVELGASLVHSTGAELWKISGHSMHEGPIVTRTFMDAPSLPQPQTRVAVPISGSGSGGSGGSGSGGGGSGSSSGSGGGSSGGSGTGGGSGSGGGGSSSGSGSTSSGGYEYQAVPQNTVTSTLMPDLYSPDLPGIYRDALKKLFGEWVAALPARSKPQP